MRNRRLEAKIAELAREKTGKELTENLKESGWDERGLVALMAWIEERFGFFFTDRGIHQNGGNVFCCDLQRLRIAAFLMLFNLCISGLPLFELTTLANTTDASVVPDILRPANAVLSLRECTFLGDKGYDVKTVYNLMKDAYEGEAVIPLNKRSTKSPEKLSVGNPICEAGLAISKDGKTTDGRGGIRQKYCCPFRQSKTGVCPCNHKNWNNGKKNRGCTKYKAIPTDYRLSVDRECLQFKRIYAVRTECERYNSRFKASGQERLWVRNGSSAANLNTVAHISTLAVALAAVLHGSHSYRSVKQLRRSA